MKRLLYILLFVNVVLFGQENYSLSFDGVDDYIELGGLNGFTSTGSHTFTNLELFAMREALFLENHVLLEA